VKVRRLPTWAMARSIWPLLSIKGSILSWFIDTLVPTGLSVLPLIANPNFAHFHPNVYIRGGKTFRALVPKASTNFEEILSRGYVNFEEPDKISRPYIIFIYYYIIIIIIINAYYN
jgi:hypothetical protein